MNYSNFPNNPRARRSAAIAAACLLALSGVVPAVAANSTLAGIADSDLDGIDDSADNCTLVPNSDQRDTDSDGFGNVCDTDLDNNCAVDFADLVLLRAVFFSTDPDADFNGDGAVNFSDLGAMRAGFFGQPGPGVGACGVTSGVLINEFLPDPFGMDEDPGGPRNGGNEAVEIVNLQSIEADLSGWQLLNAAGETLITFPQGTVIPAAVPGGDPFVLLTVLGSPTTLADDFGSDYNTGLPGAAIVFEGSDSGDRIDNDADALVLRDLQHRIVDAVLFGTVEPVGELVDEVRSGGHWAGERINMSLTDGGIPLGDGEGVLGRDRESFDSGSAADWRIHGGSDAFGGSFGFPNAPSRFPMAAEVVHHIQAYINELAAMLSIHNSPSHAPYLGFHHSAYDSLAVTRSGDDFTLAASHIFDYSSTDFLGGTVFGTLAGTIVADYTAVAGSADTLTASGTLSDPVAGRSLFIALTETISGYGSASVETHLDITLTWSDPTGSYSYTNSASQIDTWTAQDERTLVDHREYSDWSTPDLRISDATYVTTYVADGVTDTTGTLVRSEPFFHTAFGVPQPSFPSSHSELTTAYTTTINSDSNVARDYSLYDIHLLGPTTRVLYVELDPAIPASMTLTRTAGSVGDFLGSFSEIVTLPVIVYHVGMFPEPKLYTKTRDITLEYVPGLNGDPVFVARGSAVISLNGFEHSRYDYYIDGWMKWLAKGAQAAAVGLCAAGAVATAPSVVGAFGFAAGSALTVGVWQEVEKQHEDD